MLFLETRKSQQLSTMNETTTEIVSALINITSEAGCTREVLDFEPSATEFLEGKLLLFKCMLFSLLFLVIQFIHTLAIYLISCTPPGITHADMQTRTHRQKYF